MDIEATFTFTKEHYQFLKRIHIAYGPEVYFIDNNIKTCIGKFISDGISNVVRTPSPDKSIPSLLCLRFQHPSKISGDNSCQKFIIKSYEYIGVIQMMNIFYKLFDCVTYDDGYKNYIYDSNSLHRELSIFEQIAGCMRYFKFANDMFVFDKDALPAQYIRNKILLGEHSNGSPIVYKYIACNFGKHLIKNMFEFHEKIHKDICRVIYLSKQNIYFVVLDRAEYFSLNKEYTSYFLQIETLPETYLSKKLELGELTENKSLIIGNKKYVNECCFDVENADKVILLADDINEDIRRINNIIKNDNQSTNCDKSNQCSESDELDIDSNFDDILEYFKYVAYKEFTDNQRLRLIEVLITGK